MSKASSTKRTIPRVNGKPPRLPDTDGDTLEPMKAIVQFVFIHRNAEGEVVGEVAIDPVPIYRRDFTRFHEVIAEAAPQVSDKYFAGELGPQAPPQ